MVWSLKLVNGKPRHSQSQGSVERSNQDVRDMLVAWMADNKTEKWFEGLRFIQSKKNRALHSIIKTSPYEAMFGSAQKIGFADSSLSSDMYSSIKTEEELKQLLSSVKNNNQANEEEINEQSSEDRNRPQPEGEVTQESEKRDNSKIYCIISENKTSGIHKCSKCHQYVHVICGESDENNEGFGQNVTCKLCIRKNDINIERKCAKTGQKQQAQKMVSSSNSKFPEVAIGTSVAVRVPDVDRGRAALRNVLAVVAGINSSGLYQLGTKERLLKRLYARNEFIVAEINFINLQDVPSTSLTLRSASMLSSGSKQGFISCHCKRYCIDKKCKCVAKNMKCNSKCHNNSSCKNK